MTQRNAPQRHTGILSPSRRFGIRAGLATGATVTALLGAQTLAFIDQSTATANATTITAMTAPNLPSSDGLVVTPTLQPLLATSASDTSSTAGTVQAAAPQLTILTNTNTTNETTSQASSQVSIVQAISQPAISVIVAPTPALAAQPVVVQATPVQTAPRTRTSR